MVRVSMVSVCNEQLSSCDEMKNKYKSITKKYSLTFRLLYYWAKLIGINPLTLPSADSNEFRSSYYSMAYGILLTVNYSLIWYYALIDRLSNLYPGETPIVIIAAFITMCNEFFEAIQTGLIFGFYQNRTKLIVKSFLKAQKTSIKLGIRVDYEKRLRNLGICLAIITIVYTSWMMIIILPTVSVEDFKTFIWICYILPQITTYNRWMIFIWTVVIVKEKFQRLNDKVRFLLKNDDANITEEKIVSSRLIMNSNRKTIVMTEKIILIGQLHRELKDVIYRTVGHVAVCVLSSIVTQFLNMTITVHIAYRFLKEIKHDKRPNFIYLGNLGMWVFVPIGLLTIVSNVCGSTIDEANKTVKILHGVLNNIEHFSESQEAAKFNVLSLDLLQNQLRISVLGFFDLDYYLVYTAITTSTTLLTIILQFYN